MPLYEYLCRACSTEFEMLTPSGQRDAPDTVCPHCGQARSARKISLMAKPVVRGSSSPEPFDCGSPGGCCGGGCGLGK